MKNQFLVGLVVALIVGAALFNYDMMPSSNTLTQFEEFKSTYGRTYSIEENVYRFSIFVKNLEKIEKHNADKTQTYTLGITQFADMTTEEFMGIDINNLS